MTCTVTVVRGLTVIPEVIWTGPEGNLTDTKNITMGYKRTSGLVTTRSLTLRSLQSSEGGQYSCMAAVNITKLETSSQRSTHKHLNVISILFPGSFYCIKRFLCVWEGGGGGGEPGNESSI